MLLTSPLIVDANLAFFNLEILASQRILVSPRWCRAPSTSLLAPRNTSLDREPLACPVSYRLFPIGLVKMAQPNPSAMSLGGWSPQSFSD